MARRIVHKHHGKTELPDLRVVGLDYVGVDIQGHHFVPPEQDWHVKIMCSCGYSCYRQKQFAHHLAMVQEGTWIQPEWKS